MPRFSARSLERLSSVDPKLQKVFKRAIEISKQDFSITEGLRTKEQCYINWGKGRTASQCTAIGISTKYARPDLPKVTWLKNPLNSNHYNMSGVGRAVDVVPYPVDWDDLNKFKLIADAVKQASNELGVKVEWGGDWKTSKDYPHFELKG